MIPKEVSIHTPTWGVTAITPMIDYSQGFQSTHLHEVWHTCATLVLEMYCFNPHTYMRCDNLQQKVYNMLNSFNPHTYMRCDFGLAPLDHIALVSIHTPTWGVTDNWLIICIVWRFQSTHLHEVWLCPFSVTHQCLIVSIHTPTWGVTKILHSSRLLLKFQSTHLHEVWLCVVRS